MEKEKLKKICSEITEIIEKTNNENVFDNIITFFNLTSQLDDCKDKIYAIPVAQKRPTIFMHLFNHKKANEAVEIIKRQEEEKFLLLKAIRNAGRWELGCNRSKKGEIVTKQNVYFGARIAGIDSMQIADIEKYRSTKPTIYNAVASQMTKFIKNFEGCFDKVNWLWPTKKCEQVSDSHFL